MKKSKKEDDIPRGLDSAITPDQVYALMKLLREYKDALPKIEENVMIRHKVKVCYRFLDEIMIHGYDKTYEYYNDLYMGELTKKKIREEENGRG
jgi:hypothetical protein